MELLNETLSRREDKTWLSKKVQGKITLKSKTMLKNILNLNGVQSLRKTQQKSIHGGDLNNFGDVGLPDHDDHFNQGSDAERCTSSGRYWNAECNRCENYADRYFAGPDCSQYF